MSSLKSIAPLFPVFLCCLLEKLILLILAALTRTLILPSDVFRPSHYGPAGSRLNIESATHPHPADPTWWTPIIVGQGPARSCLAVAGGLVPCLIGNPRGIALSK